MTKVGGTRPALGPDAIDKYHEVMADTRAVKPSMLAALVRDYRNSREWQKLAPTTRKQWGIRLDLIEAKWGVTPISIWSDPRMVVKVKAWRDDAYSTPREADYRITVLRALLEWGRLNSRVSVNVAVGIPQIYEGGNRAEIIWTDEDISAFKEHARPDIFDGLRLASMTGLRRADLLELQWGEVGTTAIIRVTNKSKRRKPRKAVIPIYPKLRALLDELRERHRNEGVANVLVTEAGEPWGLDNFTHAFAKARDTANIVHDDGRKKHPHDLRGTFATNLILSGFTDQEAAGVLGWAPEQVANIRSHYVDQARVIVQLADRIAASTVNPVVNRKG
ncbi:tyrosine-type recombinase/integrase [Aquisediminimonas sediminicola]|uniref:tyrosine-type recombinase/integrase n=1 Tax=Alteraquisediminimonas sediminicola TaxID=2676787 RepID=UPI001C8D6147|nr:tyrosine-type recombinase/integrase [Aquisediminimonas sediminicola]